MIKTSIHSILIITGLILSLTSCEKLDSEIDVPSCIEKKIDNIKLEEVRNPPAHVWKWEVDEQTYYYVTSDNLLILVFCLPWPWPFDLYFSKIFNVQIG